MTTETLHGVTLHDLDQLPESYNGRYQSGALSQWDAERLAAAGAEEVWYWYGVGDYEGAGQILMRRGDAYGLHDASHCSCYGPTDEIAFGDGEPLDRLAARLTEEYARDVMPLIDAARTIDAKVKS